MRELIVRYDQSAFSKMPTSRDIKRLIRSIIPSSSEFESVVFHHIGDEEYSDKEISRTPKIYYGKPHKNSFSVYSLNFDLINFLEKQLKKQKSFEGDRPAGSFKVYVNEIDYIPRMHHRKIEYYTRTPIVVFTNKTRKVWDGIMRRKDLSFEAKDIEIKRILGEIIRSTIKYDLQQTINKTKKFLFVNEIDFNWTEFKAIVVKGRNEKQIGIVGKFESDYVLPRFLGRQTSLGFGEVKQVKTHINFPGDYDV